MISKKSKSKSKKITESKRSKKTKNSFANIETPTTPLSAQKNSKAATTGFKEKFKFAAVYVGDAAVKIGKKIQNSGYLTVGRAVEKMGVRIEHIEY